MKGNIRGDSLVEEESVGCRWLTVGILLIGNLPFAKTVAAMHLRELVSFGDGIVRLIDPAASIGTLTSKIFATRIPCHSLYIVFVILLLL